MLLILLCIVAGALICYFCSYDRDGMMALLGGLVGTLASIAVCAIAWALTAAFNADYEAVKAETTNIVALNDNYAGYISRYYSESELKYTYLYQDGEKGIANKSIEAEDSYINYITKDETPYIITKTVNYKNSIIDAALWPIGQHKEYYIYVPEGSIVTEGQYQIDLE